MPQFSECPFCQRLYSQHSLVIHQKNCLELKKNLEDDKKKSRRSKSSKRKSEQQEVGFVKKERERPRTRSLSRSSIDTGQFRICYVCGGQFDFDSIGQHTKLCFQDWSELAFRISEKFHLSEPKCLNIPSVDGTINIFYENQKSSQSSRNCQICRCRKCHARIPIHLAEQHQCTHYEPTIEFYF